MQTSKLVINFHTALMDGDFEKPLLDDKGIVFTLGAATKNALYAQYADEKDLSPEEKELRFWLARDIANACKKDGLLTLDPKEAETCRTMVAKAYGALIYGQAAEIFKGKRHTAPLTVVAAESEK